MINSIKPTAVTQERPQCLLVTVRENWKQTGMSERVSQWPMCQRDECWKLLGKRIRAVYVGQVARCQLLKCANFLKLQSFGLVFNLFHSFHPPPKTVHMAMLCSVGKTPSVSAPTSTDACSNPKMCWTQTQPFDDTSSCPPQTHPYKDFEYFGFQLINLYSGKHPLCVFSWKKKTPKLH